MSRLTIIFFILAICVAIVICSPVCGPNQISVNCKNTCPVTCYTYPNRTFICPHICVKGCDCVPGYILDTDNNKCVLPNDC
ncbi:PREDICTED: cysteine-rich venom protein 6-like [Polistes dominula]|uniref:Cysteine-rich venom protein 6-like n=1 Tax=Polistes dominula TaxID=743375 RepID=A0ABM1I6I2_POLDO|nr:PREDICTED: cysteine-rich venom protein 6-like [Polistes dominula]